MATTPYFILSPNLILSIVGMLHGPDKTEPTPAEDWREATVDVVIPALNEEKNIVLCLSSLAKQTLKPNRIILIDDGSTDNTVLYANEFCKENGMEIIIIQREKAIGKTPTIKRQAREFDGDVEFILDADTFLDSENYIERTVQELYQAVGIASACGTIMPMRDKDRKRMLSSEEMMEFQEKFPNAHMLPKQDLFHIVMRRLSNIYRDVLYVFLQKFVYHGQMVFFGSITNPVGCAVAYRRKYVKELFDQYEPVFGDDLTNSEDIFIGFAMLKHGYRNIQLMDVYARSQEPEAERLPHEIYLWSSSFFQSCYYFDDLVRSPLKSFKRYRLHRKMEKEQGEEIRQKRKIGEPYRQAFGDNVTTQYGRPMGWVIFLSLIEKTFFPAALLIMLILQLWEPLLVTMAVETLISVGILTAISKNHRWNYLLKGIVATPMRYMSVMYDLVTMARFAKDIWFGQKKGWRK
ncbi:MAG: glycosyltransferase family 2 protein [Helicobacteraceae bacterium]|jgi:glycosyltransferase involved in cell wall biosynthesis|nr:glycosyltransferase family 2 protein [Helicobacteraceae bacterium]